MKRRGSDEEHMRHSTDQKPLDVPTRGPLVQCVLRHRNFIPFADVVDVSSLWLGDAAAAASLPPLPRL